jgi:signal transduction histidine kinase
MARGLTMAGRRRRTLFWTIYPVLLGSVLLVAVVGAVVWHLSGVAPMVTGLHMRHTMTVGGAGSLLVLLAVAAVIGFGAYPVMSLITRRLETLRSSVEGWGAGDHSRRAPVEGDDEIAAVAASFNAAADRAEALLSAHKSLLAHASHELRSPLARLALAVEMLPGGDATAGAAIRREIGELDGLVEEILLASRLDHAPGLDEHERVDCLALAAEEAARVGVTVRSVPPATPFEVIGSPRLLRRLIRNLLENAQKHGAAPIELALDRREAWISIAVSDHGAGVAPELRERVFEPFFRPAGQSEASGSWGLGLALVRQIAQLHAGRALCERSPEGVTTFTAELPAAPAAP